MIHAQLITRLVVTLVCFAISFVAIKISSAIRKQNTDRVLTSPCEPLVPTTSSPYNTPFPQSLSPYDIRNFIDRKTQLDLTTIWSLLQIQTINLSRSDGFDPAKYPFLQNCYDCQAEAFEYELDGRPGVDILVKISDGTGRFSRYLIFGLSDEGWGEWKLLGHIDSENNKYRSSQHKVFIGGGRSWLTISSQGASGTGVATYYDRVFLVNRGGVHEVLSYQLEGHQSSSWPDNESRQFFGQLVSCELEGDFITAEIAMVVQYFGEDYLGGGNGILLWEKSQKAFFTNRLGQSEQVFDRSRSTLSERELEEVYNIDSLSEEGYFEYNVKELSSIATGKDASKREWLRRFLAKGEETAPKRRLRQLLNGIKVDATELSTG